MLFINEEEVQSLLPMDECLDVMEKLFLDVGRGQTSNVNRYRIPLPNGMHHNLAGYSAAFKATGLKTYVSAGGGGPAKMLVLLYSADTGEPLVLMSANSLGQIRTGAASGIATKYMSRENSGAVGIIGSGHQAETQLIAICSVRPIEKVWVYSRTPDKRNAFAHLMAEKLSISVIPVDSAVAAIAEADIVATITNAREPVFDGNALRNGTHINAAGSNHWMRRELDETAIRRSSTIVVDNLDQAKIECGELLWAQERRAFRWEQVNELGPVVAGIQPGRRSEDEITLFESQGIGIEDVAAGMHVYAKAKESGIGIEVEI